MVKRIFLCALISLNVTSVNAGPDEITNRLMDEAVTLLDWGIFRLEQKLNGSQQVSSANVSFNWEDNTIDIGGVNFNPWDGKTVEDAVEECEAWFSAVRRAAWVNPDTGKPMLGEYSNFIDLFTHEGWERTINGKSTSEVVEKLDRKFRLSFFVRLNGKEAGEVSSVNCIGKLLDSGFAREENRVE